VVVDETTSKGIEMSAIGKSDAQLQRDILRELSWDPRVEETHVGVEVDAGIVRLTGTVSSWAERHAAQEAAHRVVGVTDVANDIEIRPPGALGQTDIELARAVRHALEWDAFVPDALIQSTVSGGVVTLEGKVDRRSQREDAERCIRNLAGVRGIANHIDISSPPVSAETVRSSIEGALERRLERTARRVNVEVSDGCVTIRGTVPSWADRVAVLGAARGTHGVVDVRDELQIEPYG
jgi:osmotically-inducible protein OsmY